MTTVETDIRIISTGMTGMTGMKEINGICGMLGDCPDVVCPFIAFLPVNFSFGQLIPQSRPRSRQKVS